MELVTVVIPTFNSRQFIGETIGSITSQSYPSIEIILVDDGSNDGTVAVARKQLQASNARFRILELGANRGPSAARNAGLRAANGSWLQFLDSDDILMPHKLEREMAVAAAAPAEVAAVYSPWNWGFLEGGQFEFLGRPHRPFMLDRAPIMCLAPGRPLLAASLVRRTALEKAGGFDETLRFWECEEACVRLATIGRFVPSSSDEAEYFWRMRRGVLYIGAAAARYSSTAVALGWIKEALKAAGNQPLARLGLPESDRQLLMEECTTWGRLLYADDRAAFREYLGMARILDPNVTPAYPRYISALSQWTGYENAEAMANVTRKPKVWLKAALCKLKLRNPSVVMEIK